MMESYVEQVLLPKFTPSLKKWDLFDITDGRRNPYLGGKISRPTPNTIELTPTTSDPADPR
jgi:hypothetical protein